MAVLHCKISVILNFENLQKFKIERITEMDEYRKSNYAINKVRKGIVYRNADDSILEVTFEKIAKDNPNFTQEDFEKLKHISDELYHEEAMSDWNYYYHVANDLNDNVINDVFSSSLEDEILSNYDEKVFNKRLKEAIDTLLTPTQKRRFNLHFFGGMTNREIAELEKASAMSIYESIQAAQKKIKKFLRNF